MKKSELLAPAKDRLTAIEAINCGADAVYMGASAFGARRNASNTLEDIKEVIEYAHKFWVKVFVTVNTILSDEELDDAVDLIKKLEEIGVDAVIIQDMGLLKRLIDRAAPRPNPPHTGRECVPVHISTQCDNREVEKVSFFNRLGVSRVVLARELSLEQIKAVHTANPDLELEAFVHGALCVSYSGQCYLSQYIGGRSANRGECAQPCRKKYSVESTDGNIIAKDIRALCLKDFNASKHLKAMLDAGVFSFKVEGRLKESGYVKNITAYYRQELDKISKKTSSGVSVYPFTPNPEKSFNRGFTDYFLEGRNECFNFITPKSQGEYLGKVIEVKPDCFKLRTDKTISAQDGLTYQNEGFLVNKVVNNYIYPNKKVNLKTGMEIYRNLDIKFEKQLAMPVKRQIGIKVLVNGEIQLTDEDNVSVRIDFPSNETAKNQDKMNETFIKQFSKTGESDFYIFDIKIASNIPFMPVSTINELRRSAFAKLMEKRLKMYKKQVQKEMCFTPYYKKEVDYRANVHNSTAEEFYNKCSCTVKERSFESSIPEHQVELMRTKHCIKYALGMCKSPHNLILRDEHGKAYPLKFDCKNCEMAVLSP